MKKKKWILIAVSVILFAALIIIVVQKNKNGQETPAITEEPVNTENSVPDTPEETDKPKNEELPKESKIGYYLDTVITLTAYTDHPELLDEGLELCGKYEKMLSRTIEGSDVWKINHANGETVTVSPETAEILRTAVEIGKKSDGAFDITIAPVSILWDFTSGKKTIPEETIISEAVKLVNFREIEINGNEVTLPAGMMIDLGGIAKGYIADAVKDNLEKEGIESAILSFGGNIVAIGQKPDGTPWKVGIQDIDGKTGESMMVSLNFGGSTVTSGIYERGFTLDGVIYHHILDSKTGWPVQNELASVTIFSDSSMLGDALSTAVFALGLEKGGELIESIDGVEALFIARDRSATGTSGVGKYMSEGQTWNALNTEKEEKQESDEDTLELLGYVLETDTGTGYILLQAAGTSAFIELPKEGEVKKNIRQKFPDGTEWLNVIRMTPEGFSVIESNCEGHDCIEEGEVTLQNMNNRALMNMVICLPHKLTLSLCTKEEAVEISKTWR